MTGATGTFPATCCSPPEDHEFFVPLLFVSALADSAFWARHCFVARGVESHDGRRVIRLDFTPALGVDEPEWEGAAWIDSAASVLARVEFRLTNLRDRNGAATVRGLHRVHDTVPLHRAPRFDVHPWLSNGGADEAGRSRRS